MFNDIGVFEVLTLVILGVLIFGPDKLPKVIQDGARIIRKIREFSDSAKQDIRDELGPEFKDFEFEDLNPKKFVRKQLANGSDDLGLAEIRSSFDLRKEMTELTDAMTGRETEPEDEPETTGPATRPAIDLGKKSVPAGRADLSKADLDKAPAKADLTKPAAPVRPPYDVDAT